VTQAMDFAAFCDVLAMELELPNPADGSAFEDALDSLMRFEILLLVEEWAGVTLPEALIPHLVTLDDFYDVYRTRVTQDDRAAGHRGC
jgi:acyl carrier protein